MITFLSFFFFFQVNHYSLDHQLSIKLNESCLLFHLQVGKVKISFKYLGKHIQSTNGEEKIKKKGNFKNVRVRIRRMCSKLDIEKRSSVLVE